ncbi:MAG: branched-chain amino acid ABC transporter substrate-binding protein [Betaproteobacteria bacterium]|nr:branched-chain amino acid ABC transporter substrate-binding protein [Betaproteobacteria bacterium]
MSIKSSSRLIFTALVAAAFAAPAAAQNIRIGFHAPLTGFAAADGKSAVQGAELAVEQINAAGGVNGRRLELVIQDDQARPDQALPLANKFIGDGLKVVVSGSYSGPTRAAAGVFHQAKVPYVSAYAIHPDITRAGNYVFRTSFMGEVQGRAAAKLIGDNLKKKKVTLVTLNNDFGQALSAGFKEVAGRFGIQIAAEHTYAMGDRQFGSIVASVKKDDPEALYVSGYFFNGGPLVAQLRAGGVTVPIIGTEGFDTHNFIAIAKDAAEGVMITTSLDRDSSAAPMRRFIADFETKFKVPADMVAASTHTALYVVAEGLRRGGVDDGARIRAAISGLKDFEVATGRISFNELGEVYKAAQIQVIRGGKFRHFATIDDPVLLAPPTK